jgi:hypothetical protein
VFFAVFTEKSMKPRKLKAKLNESIKTSKEKILNVLRKKECILKSSHLDSTGQFA